MNFGDVLGRVVSSSVSVMLGLEVGALGTAADGASEKLTTEWSSAPALASDFVSLVPSVFADLFRVAFDASSPSLRVDLRSSDGFSSFRSDGFFSFGNIPSIVLSL